MNNTNPIHRLAEVSAFEIVREAVDSTDDIENVYSMSPEAYDADMAQRNDHIIKEANIDAVIAREMRTSYQEYIDSDPAENYYLRLPKKDTSKKRVPTDVEATKASDTAWSDLDNNKFPDGTTLGGQVLHFVFEPQPPSDTVVVEMSEAIDKTKASPELENVVSIQTVNEFMDELRKMYEEEATYYRDKFGSVFATDAEKIQLKGPEIVSANPDTLTPNVLTQLGEIFSDLDEEDVEIATEKAMLKLVELLEKIREKRTR